MSNVHSLLSTCSYCSLIDIADHLFPPIRENDMFKYDEYSNFNFWRDPVLDIPLDDLSLNTSTSSSSKSSPKAQKQQQQQPQKSETAGRSSNNTLLTTIPEK